jgi:hypothetical protein
MPTGMVYFMLMNFNRIVDLYRPIGKIPNNVRVFLDFPSTCKLPLFLQMLLVTSKRRKVDEFFHAIVQIACLMNNTKLCDNIVVLLSPFPLFGQHQEHLGNEEIWVKNSGV